MLSKKKKKQLDRLIERYALLCETAALFEERQSNERMYARFDALKARERLDAFLEKI